jgi:hypothetical protein
MPITRLVKCLGIASIVELAVTCQSAPASKPLAPPPSAAELATSFGLEPLLQVADGVPIRVVDAATQRPVPDALVVKVDELILEQYWDFDDRVEHNIYKELANHGRAWISDAEGRTRIDPAATPATLLAFHAGHFARATLEPHDLAEQVLRVETRRLEVDVVDTKGRPAPGVPVVLTKRCIADNSGSFYGVTDAKGHLTIEGEELERDCHFGCYRVTVVQFDFPSKAFALRSVDAPDLAPVRLVVPDAGKMVVDLQDVDGRPITGHAELFFDAELLSHEGRDEVYPQLGAERRSTRVSEDGHFDLGPVEPGFELSLYATCAGLVFAPETAIAPERSADTVHVVMRAIERRAEPSPSETNPSTQADTDAEQAARDAVLLPRFGPASDWSSMEITFLVGDDVNLAGVDWKLTDAQQRELSELSDFQYNFDIGTTRRIAADVRAPTEVVTFPWQAKKVIRAVPTGTYTVTLFSHGLDQTVGEVAEIEDIVIPPHSHVRDPRLRDLDLRGVVHRRVVTVVDEEGHPLTGTAYLEPAPQRGATPDDGRDVDEQADEGATNAWYFSQGRLDLTFAPTATSALVVADGFRPRTVDSLSDGQRITLKRGIPIRISLKSPLALPGGITLELRIRRESTARATSVQGRWSDLARSGSSRFFVPSPGPLDVAFTLEVRCGGSSTGSDPFPSLGAPIEVKESSEEQSFVVEPDAKVFERELASMREELRKLLSKADR